MRAGCMRPPRGQCAVAARSNAWEWTWRANGRPGLSPQGSYSMEGTVDTMRHQPFSQWPYIFFRLCSLLVPGLMAGNKRKGQKSLYSKSGRAPDRGYNASAVFLAMTFHFLWCVLALRLVCAWVNAMPTLFVSTIHTCDFKNSSENSRSFLHLVVFSRP